jgi:hypothetical protein
MSKTDENDVPIAFNGFDVIEGFDPIDKAELIGKPFGITAVRFRTNPSGVTYAEVELVNAAGESLALIDSSTGIRDQVAAYLTSKKLPVGGETEWTDVRLFVPRGLRVSVYDVQADGETKQAKTYYLTTKARRR